MSFLTHCMKSTKLIPVQVIALLEEKLNQSPVMLLLDKENNRVLPIWIGDPEARAIIVSLHKLPTPRPLTHQLLKNTIVQLQGVLEKVAIDRLDNNTFYASIYIMQNGKTMIVDARPSDAIAVALEANVPLYVEEEILQKAGQENPLTQDFKEEISQQGVEQFSQEKNIAIPQKRLTEEELEKLKKLLEEARKMEERE